MTHQPVDFQKLDRPKKDFSTMLNFLRGALLRAEKWADSALTATVSENNNGHHPLILDQAVRKE